MWKKSSAGHQARRAASHRWIATNPQDLTIAPLIRLGGDLPLDWAKQRALLGFD
jgi:hypothetical protein